MRLVVVLAALVALGGCAVTNETSVPVGTPPPAPTAEKVKINSTPPKKYVDIAIIQANAAHDFMNKQALMDTAVQNAKMEAAKVGANGILLDGLGDYQVGSSGVVMVQNPATRGAPAFGVGSSNNRTGKQLSGKAIYVTEE